MDSVNVLQFLILLIKMLHSSLKLLDDSFVLLDVLILLQNCRPLVFKTFSSSLILLSTSKLDTFSWLEIEGEGVLKKEEDDFVRSGVEIERPL